MRQAENQLGILYFNGRGVRQDYDQARQWYLRAAAQGDANAQCNLGILYYEGEGVPKDYAEAARWYQLAAGQGLLMGEGNLGFMYATGQGVPQDNLLAYMWFSLAAAQGDTTASDNRYTLAARMTAPGGGHGPADDAGVEAGRQALRQPGGGRCRRRSNRPPSPRRVDWKSG